MNSTLQPPHTMALWLILKGWHDRPNGNHWSRYALLRPNEIDDSLTRLRCRWSLFERPGQGTDPNILAKPPSEAASLCSTAFSVPRLINPVFTLLFLLGQTCHLEKIFP